MSMTGKKFDQDKPRMDLLDTCALVEVARVMTFGAKKYGDHNWRGGLTYGRLVAAALRHIFAFLAGEDNDPETGISHIAHAMCCLMMLLWHIKHRKDCDDRFKIQDKCPRCKEPCSIIYTDDVGGSLKSARCEECVKHE